MGLFDGILSTVKDVASAFSPVAPFISAGANLIGGAMSNSANQAQAQANRDFQAGQSATSYQRAVADMQAAGLSPMLAYSQGGASTPSGSTATMVNPVPEATRSYETSRINTQELENMKATKLATEAATAASIAQARKTEQETNNMIATLPWNIASLQSTSRLNNASASNQEKGIAPSADPYWYRDSKRFAEKALPYVVPSPSAIANSKAVDMLFPGIGTILKGKK